MILLKYGDGKYTVKPGAVVAMIVWQLDLQLPMQSAYHPDVLSSNLDQGEVYNIM